MSLSLCAWTLLLLASTAALASGGDVSFGLLTLLRHLDTLHLHLRNLDDANDNFVQYLLQQEYCAVRVSVADDMNFGTNEADRHHFYVYEDLTEMALKWQEFVNRGGYYICSLDQSPDETLLARFAQRLWQEYTINRIFYILGMRILFYNPFVRSDQEFGALIDGRISDFSNVFKNLNGYQVPIYIFNSTYSVVFGDPDTERIYSAIGADSKAAELLSKQMNFSIEYSWPDDAFFGGRMSNGSFSGALGRILRHEIEIIMSGFFIKDYLTRDIDFTTGVYMDELCCYVQKAKRIPQSILPLFAIRTDVWFGFFLVGFMSTFLWLGIRGLNKYFNIARIKSTTAAPLPNGMWNQCKLIFIDTWVVWVRVNIVHFPPFNSERVFVVSLSLVSVIFGALLESSLATVYIRPLYYRDINTLSELDMANLRIYTKHPAIKDDMFYGHTSELYQNLNSKIVFVAEYDERLINIIAKFGRFAGVTRGAALKLFDIRYVMTKKVHKIPECPKNYHIAYVLRKHSPYLGPINLLLLRMREAGLIDQWILEMEQKAKLSMYHFEEYLAELGYRWKTLTLKNVQLAFYALCLGCLLATIVLLLEFMSYFIHRYLTG